MSVHSYQREGDALSAWLVLSNAGAVSVAVPLRYECQVDRGDSVTNYLVDTRYIVWLEPRDVAILSNALWQVPLPANVHAWKVDLRIRRMSWREGLVNALSRSGVKSQRLLSRIAGRPDAKVEYRWQVCPGGWWKVPETLDPEPAQGKDDQ